MTVPGLAQFGGFGGQRSGNFDSFFTPFSAPRPPSSERSGDYSRAPSPRRLDNQPKDNVLVLGDSMSDWLAYGLEDALGDTPDLAVVRRNRSNSGLIRFDTRNEAQDWAAVVREAIATSKPKFIVMMVGLNDRQPIRERVAAPAAPAAPLQPGAATAAAPSTVAPPAAVPPVAVQPSAVAPDASKPDATDPERPSAGQPAIVAPEPPKAAAGAGRFVEHEFRTDEWAVHYARRIDATIAAMKTAGVPVFWVGLPSIRGPKATADVQYLNDLYRARVEKASVNYIDVWDGFVDENGRFALQGPDFEGQIRRLRVGDGLHFTRAGARKLAHYLEREIRRVMLPGSEPIALPQTEPLAPAVAARPSGVEARPLAGPVVPLTVSSAAGQDLIGNSDPSAASRPKFVTRTLVNGEPSAAPAGRADDFKWPRRGIAPLGSDPIVATTTEPIPVMKPAPETTVAAPNSEVRPVAAANPARRSATTGRAPAPPPQQNQNPFSFFSFGR